MRAEDEARTRDLNLGKVALYQLSYFRIKNIIKRTITPFVALPFPRYFFPPLYLLGGKCMECIIPEKIFCSFTYTGAYKGYFPGH